MRRWRASFTPRVHRAFSGDSNAYFLTPPHDAAIGRHRRVAGTRTRCRRRVHATPTLHNTCSLSTIDVPSCGVPWGMFRPRFTTSGESGSRRTTTRWRARSVVGGTLSVARHPEGGTEVRLDVPVRARREHAAQGPGPDRRRPRRWSGAACAMILDAAPDLEVVAEVGDGVEAVERALHGRRRPRDPRRHDAAAAPACRPRGELARAAPARYAS